MNELAELPISAGGQTSTAPPPELTPDGFASKSRILIVDDESTTVAMVRHILGKHGFANVDATTDGLTASALVKHTRPDIVLLDLSMPDISGLDVLKAIRGHAPTAFTPVIIVTAETDRTVRAEALRLGATDFLQKPIDPSELVARSNNILSVKKYQDTLRRQNETLEQAVRERTAQLEAARMDAIYCLARAAEYRDDDTGNHVRRVGRYARIIGEELGFVGEAATTLECAAQLHDVGKIGVPDAILMKPGRLTADEFELMQKHCSNGKRIFDRHSSGDEMAMKAHAELGSCILDCGTSPVLMLAKEIALTHHEWWDGSGYPLGLAGEDIPIEGRITAVADVFDALSSKRCYKEPFPLDKCFTVLSDERGTHFDPQVVDAFFRRRQQIVNALMQYAD